MFTILFVEDVNTCSVDVNDYILGWILKKGDLNVGTACFANQMEKNCWQRVSLLKRKDVDHANTNFNTGRYLAHECDIAIWQF